MVHDGLGSVRAQVDATGAIVADQWYDPYGQVIDDNGTWVGSFGYAGEQTDESGLGYNRARYYNPAMGAFASLDPFEGVMHEPMSMNGYGYVHGNPVNNTDPSGELLPALAIGGAIGAAIAIGKLVLSAGAALATLIGAFIAKYFVQTVIVLVAIIVNNVIQCITSEGCFLNIALQDFVDFIDGILNPPSAEGKTPEEELAEQTAENIEDTVEAMTEILNNTQSDAYARTAPLDVVKEAEKVRDKVGEYHITLSLDTHLALFTAYVQFDVLPDFNTPVLPYGKWAQTLGTPEISPSNRNGFSLAFPIAAMGAEKIHFNLQGILNSTEYQFTSYDDYIDRGGSSGQFTGRFVTADELYWVKYVFCSKTEFYKGDGAGSWQPDPTAKATICSS